eukprot:NODE_6977_length_822_cov_23.497854_g6376_i0.p1 GENE.NODE_6977_length_822_cov_23.497854_g6376_i0~~NODE_6977_length_822_cov_23.497854_g6376_i0.p1  ORF type:complete len:196 (+),score=20.28 NODE_6977_length_822_cov_23.497854_g6376_i0:134-721(+)
MIIDGPPEWTSKIKSNDHIRWPAHKIKSFIGISGPYSLKEDRDVFHKRGLHTEIFMRIFENSLSFYSPILRINDPSFEPIANQMPPIYLMHGTSDKTCTVDNTINLSKTLEKRKLKVTTKYYRGTSHSGPILEDLMNSISEGNSAIVDDIVNIVQAQELLQHRKPEPSSYVVNSDFPNYMIHPFLLELAKLVNPF